MNHQEEIKLDGVLDGRYHRAKFILKDICKKTDTLVPQLSSDGYNSKIP